jgi:hypothetical protein
MSDPEADSKMLGRAMYRAATASVMDADSTMLGLAI